MSILHLLMSHGNVWIAGEKVSTCPTSETDVWRVTIGLWNSNSSLTETSLLYLQLQIVLSKCIKLLSLNYSEWGFMHSQLVSISSSQNVHTPEKAHYPHQVQLPRRNAVHLHWGWLTLGHSTVSLFGSRVRSPAPTRELTLEKRNRRKYWSNRLVHISIFMGKAWQQQMYPQYSYYYPQYLQAKVK